jgi:RHS repeat-associated protein
MSVTNYYSAHGELIGEWTAGGQRLDYLTDAVGSIVGTVDQAGALVNTYRYKPYGPQLAKTGSGIDPAFRWGGGHGYRQTGNLFGEIHVRARHYSTSVARWITPDPLDVVQRGSPYVYAQSSPVTLVDPSGLACAPLGDCCPEAIERARESKEAKDHCPGGAWEECYPDRGNPRYDACAGADCKALLAELDEMAKDCVLVCGWVLTPPPNRKKVYRPGARWDMQTVCCGPPSRFCAFLCCEANFGNLEPCVQKCVATHEYRHELQCSPNWQPPKPVPYPPRTDEEKMKLQAFAECQGYEFQVECLWGAIIRNKCLYKDPVDPTKPGGPTHFDLYLACRRAERLM